MKSMWRVSFVVGRLLTRFRQPLKKIPFFVATEDICGEMEDMTVYVKTDWEKLKEDMLTCWVLLEQECNFTVGQILEFCKHTWVSGRIAHCSGYQPFCHNFDVMVTYLVKKGHISSRKP